MTLRIALTGGIGSGKTTVSDIFASVGVPVIDADEISRAVTNKGGPAYPAIMELFGTTVVDEKGELHRDRIRKAVFSNDALRTRLESIVHPLVRREIDRRISAISYPYCIISIPLLLESGRTSAIDRILVVDVPEELQIERARKRDRAGRSDIERIISKQADRSSRLQAADDVLQNDAGLDMLRERVLALHQRYLKIAAHSTARP